MAHQEMGAGQVVVEHVQGGFKGGVQGEGGDLVGEAGVGWFLGGADEVCGVEEGRGESVEGGHCGLLLLLLLLAFEFFSDGGIFLSFILD